MKNIRKIKSWKLFTEGKQLDLFQGSIFEKPELQYENGLSPVSQEDILRELEAFGDEDYLIRFEYGRVDDEDEFIENITFTPFKPCVSVTIIATENSSDVNLTLRLKSFYNKMKRKFDKILFEIEGYLPTINEIVIEDGRFKTIDEDSDDEVIGNELKISMIWFEEIQLSTRQVLQYYAHNGDLNQLDIEVDEKGNLLLCFYAEDLVDRVCAAEGYKDYLDMLYKEYWLDSFDSYSDYLPDAETLFYHLDDENISLIINKFIGSRFDELSEEYSKLKNYSGIEDFISKVQKSGWDNKHSMLAGKILSELDSSEELYRNIRQLYSDMQHDDSIYSIRKSIISEFESTVEKNLDTTIVKYDFHKGDRRAYLVLNTDWVSDEVFEELERGDSIDWLDCIEKYVYPKWGTRYMERFRPDVEQNGDVDRKGFNEEVKSMIEELD